MHSEAEKLEHDISEDMERRIATALGDPARDPHGEPIPTRELVMPPDPSVPLETIGAGQKAVVRRVDSHDDELLRHLNELGLLPGARLEVVDVSQFEHLMHVRISGHKTPSVLGPIISAKVFVEIP